MKAKIRAMENEAKSIKSPTPPLARLELRGAKR